MNSGLYASETAIDKVIMRFQAQLGIIDEGAIVDEDDFESSHEITIEEN